MADIDISLKFDCPTCGAGCGEKCLSYRRSARCESHQERWEVAANHRPAAHPKQPAVPAMQKAPPIAAKSHF